MKLLFVGDVMLGRLVNQALKHRPAESVWGNTLPLFQSADFRACNLECVISDRGRPWSATRKVFHFRSDAKHVDVLSAPRINAVSLANNHILDYEYDAMFDAMDILRSAHIGFAGCGKNLEEASQPYLTAVDEAKIAFIACTDNEPGWQAKADSPGVFYVPIALHDPRAKHLFGRVESAKQQAALVIVSLHWGPNWGYEAPEDHRNFAHALVEAGADIVFGHSPHVFRGVEIFHHRLILYSAGDFIDDYAVDEVERNDESFIFVVEASSNVIHQLRMYPTMIENCAARRARDEPAKIIANKMTALCKTLGTTATWEETEQSLTVDV